LNYKQFSIRGTNPETGRKKTITLDVPNITTPYEMVSKQKILNEPYEINEIPFRPPSDRQLEYAKGLGVKNPSDACLEDVSALISFAVDSDSEPNPELVEFATNRGFTFSKYIGKKALYDLIFYRLSPLDKIAFFCFSVYRYLSDDRHGNLDTSPHRDTFYSFAQQHEGDKKFVDSMLKYEGKDLRYFGTMRIKEEWETISVHGGSIQTGAYRTVANYLHDKFNTPLTLTKKMEGKPDFNSYKKRADENERRSTPANPSKKKNIIKVVGIIFIIIGAVGLFDNIFGGLLFIGCGIALLVHAKKKPVEQKSNGNKDAEDIHEQTVVNADASQLAAEAAAEAANEESPDAPSTAADPTVELK